MRPVASPLFQGLSAEEWAALEQSGCLRTKSYPRHAVIFHAGEQVHALGVVLRGTVHIENLDLWGSKSILSSISAGQAFAETYALCGDVMMVDAVAAEECEVRKAAAQPAHGVHAQKPEPFAAHLLHHPQDRAGPSADLLFCTGRPQRQSAVRDPVQPAAAGRLPQSGPQRPLQRAVQNAGRRFAGI